MNPWFVSAIGIAMVMEGAPLDAGEKATVRRYHFSELAHFDRKDFRLSRKFPDKSGKSRLILRCYSLNDTKREHFTRMVGSDPVADLSCYLMDTNHPNEYTILGLPGESLQFSPAFFWLKEMSRCHERYAVVANVRGVSVRFEFTKINMITKTAVLSFMISPMPMANNPHLREADYRKQCK